MPTGGKIQPLEYSQELIKKQEFPTTEEWGKLFSQIQAIHNIIQQNDASASEWKAYLVNVSSVLYGVYPQEILKICNNEESDVELLSRAAKAMSVIAALYPYRSEPTKIVFGGVVSRLKRVVNTQLSQFRSKGNLEAVNHLASIITWTDVLYI